MNLKEQIAKEAALFLNPKEFGESITVNGLEMLGCWDEKIQPSPEFSRIASGSRGVLETRGVNTVERCLFLLSNDPDWPCPVSGQELEIDGDTWTVRDARPECGIFQLTVYRNES